MSPANPGKRASYRYIYPAHVYARWGSPLGGKQKGIKNLKIGKSTSAPPAYQFWEQPGDCAIEAYIQARLTFDGYIPYQDATIRICEWFVAVPWRRSDLIIHPSDEERIVKDLNRYYAEAKKLVQKGNF
jgi:hypothetical protein